MLVTSAVRDTSPMRQNTCGSGACERSVRPVWKCPIYGERPSRPPCRYALESRQTCRLSVRNDVREGLARIDEVRCEPERLAELGDRLFPPAEAREKPPEIIVGQQEVRFGACGRAIVHDRGLGAAELS